MAASSASSSRQEDQLEMPSKSKAQQKLMRAAAHNKDFAKKSGVSQSVARDFVAADKAKPSKKMKKGK